jgi:hypothetical protein
MKISKNNQYFFLALFYILAYVFCMQFAVMINQTEHSIYKKIDNMNKSCIIGSGDNKLMKKLSSYRGENYYLTETDIETTVLDNCFMSFYNLTHLLLYIGIGIVCPDLRLESFLIGTVFELYEYYYLDCHDPLDIIYNVFGFEFGKYINNKI